MTRKNQESASSQTLPCLICEKPLENIGAEVVNQPEGGLEFITMGDYGSTIFDSIWSNQGEPNKLIVNICDDCLRRASKKGLVAAPHPHKRKLQGWEAHC